MFHSDPQGQVQWIDPVDVFMVVWKLESCIKTKSSQDNVRPFRHAGKHH